MGEPLLSGCMLRTTDPIAQDLLWEYARRLLRASDSRDRERGEMIHTSLREARYQPPREMPMSAIARQACERSDMLDLLNVCGIKSSWPEVGDARRVRSYVASLQRMAEDDLEARR